MTTTAAAADAPGALDVAFKAYSITSHVADIGTDFYTGIKYILRGDLWWGGLTLVLMLLSMLIIAFITWRDATNKHVRRLSAYCFPFAGLGALCWDWLVTYREYKHGKNTNASEPTNNTNTSEGVQMGDNPSNESQVNNDNSNSPASVNDTDSINVPGTNANASTNQQNNSNSDDVNTGADNTSTTSTALPPHVEAAAGAKFLEAFTEALPQSCIGSHVIMQSTYNPEAQEDVKWYQIASLMLSICSLTVAIATSASALVGETSKRIKAFLFIFTLPLVTGRLMLWSTMGLIHPAMFILPPATELLAFYALWIIKCYSGAKLYEWKSVIVLTSSISIWYAIAGFFTPVDLAISITSMVINVIAGLVQIGAWWVVVSV